MSEQLEPLTDSRTITRYCAVCGEPVAVQMDDLARDGAPVRYVRCEVHDG